MTEKITQVITGLVSGVKPEWKSVQIDGNWYGNKFFKGTLPNKGDSVELTVQVNGQYKNLMECKVLKATEKSDKVDFRTNVDAGNLLQRAVELTVACMPRISLEADVEVDKLLSANCRLVLSEFNKLKDQLENPVFNEDGTYK